MSRFVFYKPEDMTGCNPNSFYCSSSRYACCDESDQYANTYHLCGPATLHDGNVEAVLVWAQHPTDFPIWSQKLALVVNELRVHSDSSGPFYNKHSFILSQSVRQKFGHHVYKGNAD